MLKKYNTNYLSFFLIFFFLIIYLSPILAIYIKTIPENYVISLFNGSINSTSRLPQYFPILNEFMESGFKFENSVNSFKTDINIENVRFVPFLIASFPSIIRDNLNFIIFVNYLMTFCLNIFILFLISKEFLKNNFYSIISALLTFFFFNILTFNPINVLSNIFINPFIYKINYSSISSDVEILFQSISNFLLLSFFYSLIIFRKKYFFYVFAIVIILFLLNAFSYQSHFIVCFFIFVLISSVDFFVKNLKFYKYFIFNFIISILFLFFLIFHYNVINSSSWSSEEFVKINLLSNILSSFDFFSFLRFFLNTYFILFIVSLIISKKDENKIILNSTTFLSMFFSFIYFSSDLLNMELQRLIFRGSNVILTPLIFIFFIKIYLSFNKNLIKKFSIILIVILFFLTTLKFSTLTHYNLTSNAGLLEKSRYNLYKHIKYNYKKNVVIASFDHVDMELLPVYTNADLFFASIFNSYEKPEHEVSKYIFISKKIFGKNITFKYLKNLEKTRNTFKENLNKIKSTYNNKKIKYPISDSEFDIWLFSRNILGFTVFSQNLFKNFNNKKINQNYENFFDIQIKEIETENTNYKMPDLIILNKNKNEENTNNNYKLVYENRDYLLLKLINF